MRTLRVGLLGAGGIGARHARALAALSDRAELVACCGRDPDRTAAFAAQHNAAPYTSFARMREDAALDLLIVALPPYAHTGQVEAAAEAGIHVLVEKPIALDMERADSMVHVTQAAGIVAACGFMYRFGEAVTAWDAMDKGRPGLFTGYFHCNDLHAPWWRQRALSGGQTVEQLIHIVDLARHNFGMPRTVYARAANLFHRNIEGYDSEDVAAMMLGYDGGQVAVLTATNAAIPGRWDKGWTIVCESATGKFSDFNTGEIVRTRGDVQSTKIAGDRDVFVAQLENVLDAIEHRRAPKVPLSEGRDTLRIVLAVRQSSEEGREVALGR